MPSVQSARSSSRADNGSPQMMDALPSTKAAASRESGIMEWREKANDFDGAPPSFGDSNAGGTNSDTNSAEGESEPSSATEDALEMGRNTPNPPRMTPTPPLAPGPFLEGTHGGRSSSFRARTPSPFTGGSYRRTRSGASSPSGSKGSRGSRGSGRFRLTGRVMTQGTKDLLLGTIANAVNNKNDEASSVGMESGSGSGHGSDERDEREVEEEPTRGEEAEREGGDGFGERETSQKEEPEEAGKETKNESSSLASMTSSMEPQMSVQASMVSSMSSKVTSSGGSLTSEVTAKMGNNAATYRASNALKNHMMADIPEELARGPSMTHRIMTDSTDALISSATRLTSGPVLEELAEEASSITSGDNLVSVPRSSRSASRSVASVQSGASSRSGSSRSSATSRNSRSTASSSRVSISKAVKSDFVKSRSSPLSISTGGADFTQEHKETLLANMKETLDLVSRTASGRTRSGTPSSHTGSMTGSMTRSRSAAPALEGQSSSGAQARGRSDSPRSTDEERIASIREEIEESKEGIDKMLASMKETLNMINSPPTSPGAKGGDDLLEEKHEPSPDNTAKPADEGGEMPPSAKKESEAQPAPEEEEKKHDSPPTSPISDELAKKWNVESRAEPTTLNKVLADTKEEQEEKKPAKGMSRRMKSLSMKKIHLPSKPKLSKGGGYESDKEAAASDSEVLRSPRKVKMKKLHFKKEDAGAASDGEATKSPRQLKAKKFREAGSLSVKKIHLGKARKEAGNKEDNEETPAVKEEEEDAAKEPAKEPDAETDAQADAEAKAEAATPIKSRRTRSLSRKKLRMPRSRSKGAKKKEGADEEMPADADKEGEDDSKEPSEESAKAGAETDAETDAEAEATTNRKPGRTRSLSRKKLRMPRSRSRGAEKKEASEGKKEAAEEKKEEDVSSSGDKAEAETDTEAEANAITSTSAKLRKMRSLSKPKIRIPRSSSKGAKKKEGVEKKDEDAPPGFAVQANAKGLSIKEGEAESSVVEESHGEDASHDKDATAPSFADQAKAKSLSISDRAVKARRQSIRFGRRNTRSKSRDAKKKESEKESTAAGEKKPEKNEKKPAKGGRFSVRMKRPSPTSVAIEEEMSNEEPAVENAKEDETKKTSDVAKEDATNEDDKKQDDAAVATDKLEQEAADVPKQVLEDEDAKSNACANAEDGKDKDKTLGEFVGSVSSQVVGEADAMSVEIAPNAQSVSAAGTNDEAIKEEGDAKKEDADAANAVASEAPQEAVAEEVAPQDAAPQDARRAARPEKIPIQRRDRGAVATPDTLADSVAHSVGERAVSVMSEAGRAVTDFMANFQKKKAAREETAPALEQEEELVKADSQPELSQSESKEDQEPQQHLEPQEDDYIRAPSQERVLSGAGNIELHANFDDVRGLTSAKPAPAGSTIDDESSYDVLDEKSSFPMIRLTETAKSGKSKRKEMESELKALEEEEEEKLKEEAEASEQGKAAGRKGDEKSEKSTPSSKRSWKGLKGGLSTKKLRFVKVGKDDASSAAPSAASGSAYSQELKKRLRLKGSLRKIKSAVESPKNRSSPANDSIESDQEEEHAKRSPKHAAKEEDDAATDPTPAVTKDDTDSLLNEEGEDKLNEDSYRFKSDMKSKSSHASTRAVMASVMSQGSDAVAGKALTSAMDKKAEGKAKLETAMRELKEKQAAAAAKRDAAKEKANKKKELEKELKADLRSMKSDKKKQKQHLTSAKRERKIQERELAAARKKASIAKAKLEQAKAEQEAARVEAEAIAAREEAKRVLEELKEVKTEVQQMTASNKKKQEKLTMLGNRSPGGGGVDGHPEIMQEFSLRVKEDQTLVSELTGNFDDYTLNNTKDEGDGEVGFGACGLNNARFEDMVQGFLHWFMGDEDDQEEERKKDRSFSRR